MSVPAASVPPSADASPHDASSPSRSDAHEAVRGPVSVAVLGSGSRAAAIVRALGRVEGVVVAEVWCPREDLAAAVAGDEVGAVLRRDLSAAAREASVSIVIDATGDERARAAVRALVPSEVELIAGDAATLLGAVLRERDAQEQVVFKELEDALDRVRAQERRLFARKDALERANESLERDLSEMFFMHEFLTSLTSYRDADDVCSLIVDGVNGMFGAEVSAVYVVDQKEWRLHLEACQGRSAELFRDDVPIADTWLGDAFRDGLVGSAADRRRGAGPNWLDDRTLCTELAIGLRAGVDVIAVLAMGFYEARDLSDAELERLQAVADQSGLALQNALLHGELERLSVTDRLTGLFNRGFFEQRLDAEVSRASRFSHSVGLVMLDIDDFKSFNDTFGHPAGDELLRAVSRVIRDNLREMDTAARYGGEEFVLVLPETSLEGARAVADRIRREIEHQSVEVDGGEASRTASLGVVSGSGADLDAGGLVRRADEALYRAKRSGKNRVESPAD